MNEGMKKIAFAIVTTITCGLVAFAGSTYKDFIGVEVNVGANTHKINKAETAIDSMKVDVKALRWYFLDRKGISPPKGK